MFVRYLQPSARRPKTPHYCRYGPRCFFHRGHRIAAGLFEVALHLLVLGQCAPAGLTDLIRHLFGHGLAGQLGTVEVNTSLHHPVTQQLIKPGVGALDDQRRQRHHRLGRVLHDAAHDLLETFGDAVQLVLQGVGEAHVSAHHVRLPRSTDTESVGAIERARRARCRAATDGVHHPVVEHFSLSA